MSRLSKTSALAAHTPERHALDVEKACSILAACTTVPAARDVRDKAKAIAVFHRSKRSSIQIENQARTVVLRAERRMKELVLDDPARAKVGRPKKNGVDSPHTFEELGIDKEEAKRLRQHAKIDDATFEEHVRAVCEAAERLTLAKVAAPPDSSKRDYDGDESYTPVDVIEDVKHVLGTIDLDPFSCAAAQKRIGARIHYTKDPKSALGGGLLKPWKGRCWFQPPYSLEIIEAAVEKLLTALAGVDASHDVTECLGLTNQSEAAWWHALARKATAICQTSGRINFDQPDGKGGMRKTQSNRFAQTFFYFGSRLDRFEERFEKRGTIFTPRPRRLTP